MDPQLKAKWIEALRSGEYEQNIGSVGGYKKTPNKLCCIGVGGRVAGLNAGFVGDKLTKDCADALGLSDDQYEVLWRMNDDERKPFSKIADYIEEHL